MLCVFWYHLIVSSRVSVPPWNIDLTPFYLAPPPPKKNSKSVRPLPLWATFLKILENLTTPLKYTLVQKSKDLIFKETKDFISNNEIKAHLNIEISIYSCKI